MQFQQMSIDRWRNEVDLNEQQIIQGLLEYAANVRDELEVYQFMSEQQVGVCCALYWLSWLNQLQNKGDFVQLATLLQKIRVLSDVDEKWRIDHFEILYVRHLENLVKSRFRGRRKLMEFQGNNGLDADFSSRTIDNVEVYTNQKASNSDKIKILTEIIVKDIPELSIQLQLDYNIQQQGKPWSFLQSDRQLHLQIIKICKSTVSNSNKRMIRESQQKEDSLDMNKPKGYITIGENLEDSVEILKRIQKRKRIIAPQQSPKSKDEFQQIQQICEQEMRTAEKCRSTNEEEGLDPFEFSFSRTKPTDDCQKKSRYSEDKVTKQANIDDNAFMFNSFNQEFMKINVNTNENDDFELQLIIKQIQRENYQEHQIEGWTSVLFHKQENKISGSSYNLEDLIDLEEKSQDSALNHHIEENPEMNISDNANNHQSSVQYFRQQFPIQFFILLQETNRKMKINIDPSSIYY